MTDYQFDSILGMVDLILAGCDSVEEAREKLAFFRKNRVMEMQMQERPWTNETKNI